MDRKEFIDNPDISGTQFIEDSINYSSSPEEQETLKNKGVPLGLWNTYRKRYNWQPFLRGQESLQIMKLIKYYNGEEGYLLYPLEENFRNETRPIPGEKSDSGQAYFMG